MQKRAFATLPSVEKLINKLPYGKYTKELRLEAVRLVTD
jgi:hypothetical protein